MVKVASIRIEDSELFLTDFMRGYLEGGFGRMNKTDFEFFFFHLLIKHGCFNDMSNFDIGLLLKIPESKVRRLKYEAELRYGNHENFDDLLLSYLINCRFEYYKDNIKLSFEDKFIQTLFVSELKKMVSSLSDFTKNPEVVTVTRKAFVDFLVNKYCQFEEDPFMDEYEDDDIAKIDGEAGIHYCVRILIEESKPLSTVLDTISSILHNEAQPRALVELI